MRYLDPEATLFVLLMPSGYSRDDMKSLSFHFQVSNCTSIALPYGDSWYYRSRRLDEVANGHWQAGTNSCSTRPGRMEDLDKRFLLWFGIGTVLCTTIMNQYRDSEGLQKACDKGLWIVRSMVL